MPPEISIIIPTIGRDKVLVDTLVCLSKQVVVDFEIIVVDQNDTPLYEFENYKRSNCLNIKHYKQKEKNASSARNLGSLVATSDIILFLDDDIDICSDDFLMRHLDNYKDNSICGVAGQILGRDKFIRNRRHSWSYSSSFGWLYFPLNFDKREFIFGVGGAGNFSVRRSVFLSVGGMDENFIKGAFREETDFICRLWKAGYKIVYDPLATLVHIGELSGGIRSWGRLGGLHPLHHLIGEWYFILNHISLTNFLHLMFSVLRRQILNRPYHIRFCDIPVTILRSMKGFFVACLLKYHGGKTLLNDDVCRQHLAEIDAFHDCSH